MRLRLLLCNRFKAMMDSKEQAFTAMIKQYKSIIYSVCMMYADKPEDTDDLVQKALIHLRKRFPPHNGLTKSWVWKVTMNSCISADRNYYLDNLKVFLTLLVIFHHAGQAYGNGGGWAYTPSNPSEYMPWIWHFFSVNAGFFMGLFFLISGYFVPKSYDRQGGKTFVKKKLLRLGIPLLIMGAITSSIIGTLEVAHMWFVESLLVFCLLYALIRCFCKPISEDCTSRPTVPALLLLGVIMGIGSYFIRKVSPQDNWIMVPLKIEPAHYLQYVMMFVVGVLSSRFNWFEKMSNKTGAILFPLA